MRKQKVIFIVGPTAVGKSELSIDLARRINGEILCCDSMQIYKEINIANNKPSKLQQKKIPHYGLDLVSVYEEYDVVKFFRYSKEVIKDMIARGKVPIVVGGSGMYVQTLLDGVFESVSRNDSLRHELAQMAENQGNKYIHDKLMKLDKIAADKIHVNDLKRIIRALEVCTTEKEPISELQKKRKGLSDKYDIVVFVINKSRSVLYDDINKRAEEMLREGLLTEIEKLEIDKLSTTARGMIGLKEVKSCLAKEISEQEALELLRLHTRRYAKRQLTWFRKDKRFTWIEINENNGIKDAAAKILEIIHL